MAVKTRFYVQATKDTRLEIRMADETVQSTLDARKLLMRALDDLDQLLVKECMKEGVD